MSTTILVIDDDQEILDILKLLLNLEKYNVLTAQNGITGLFLARENNPAMIILDLNLPDIDGQQICKIIRSELDVPILILSARDNVSDKVVCLEYGADDYMTKPFENIELIARVKAILRRAEKTGPVQGDDSEDTVFHHMHIDRANRQVFIRGEKISLTPKEYDILVYFIEKAGQVLSRDTIVNDIWGKNSIYSWSRSLDVHIKNLRQKVEINPKNPDIIKTVSGVGYKIKK
ncbi:response regulator transcription factor [Seleniivibrio woodruffii]|uniref:response regulator transcription factor n=1 Tax=Seleniivibrio woodruffii TaxID=1078050 RepID=UPI0026F18A6E|nr:response regulator transcription factor [Seleniivibrio woodruffii]